ncbi:MAG: SH3 domain-containing protein [Deltaproteobacteria bacterium]|nr:SH3 domain-containing protein [Deltaproteobacteria bacterium]
MKHIIRIVLMLTAVSLAGTVAAASAKEMTVQVNQTQLRTMPAYYGSVVATVNYADRLKIIETKDAWVKASSIKSNTTGWVHLSALTSKKLAPRSGVSDAPTSVSAGELSAAEKGFTEQIERDYRQKNGSVDFTWVDRMEKINVTARQSESFLAEGQLSPSEGGTK